MSDYVDTPLRLLSPPETEPKEVAITVPFGEGTSVGGHSRRNLMYSPTGDDDDVVEDGLESGCGKKCVCRICHEEEDVTKMEAPCACNGSIKFAHRECILKWCIVKDDTFCELCHKHFRPNYDIPPPVETISDIPVPALLAMMNLPPWLLEGDDEEPVDDYEPLPADGYFRGRHRRRYRCCTKTELVQAILCGCNTVLLLLLLFKDIFFTPDTRSQSSLIYYLMFALLVPSYLSSYLLDFWKSRRGRKRRVTPIVPANRNTVNADRATATEEVVIDIETGERVVEIGQRAGQYRESGREDPNHMA